LCRASTGDVEVLPMDWTPHRGGKGKSRSGKEEPKKEEKKKDAGPPKEAKNKTVCPPRGEEVKKRSLAR